MSITSQIEFLLTSHDCVIVPGIGAVLAHGLPAYYDEALRRWFPPARVFSFNPQLSRTDGLLTASVARRDNISMDAAAAVVRSATDAMRRSLESERHLSLGEVGTLRLNPDGLMSFTPGDADWLSPATMWLPALSLENVSREESAVSRRIAAEARRRRRGEVFRRIASVAACIAVVIALGWIALTNLSTSPALQYASIAPVEAIGNAEADGTFAGEISDAPAEVILAQEPALDSSANAAASLPAASDSRYLLIVASLSSMEDAERFVSQYKDLNLGIFNNDGRYRIYAAAGNSWDEVAAVAYSPGIYENFSSAWVCAR